MSILNDKEFLSHALGLIDKHVENWAPRYKIYELEGYADIPDYWSVILITTNKRFIVTDNEKEARKLETFYLGHEVTKQELIASLKLFEDVNYKIYYKNIEQKLVGYLLDFFIYYVEMPDKIITECDDNTELYNRIRKQKLSDIIK